MGNKNEAPELLKDFALDVVQLTSDYFQMRISAAATGDDEVRGELVRFLGKMIRLTNITSRLGRIQSANALKTSARPKRAR